MDFRNFFKSQIFKGILYGIGVAVVLLIVFQFGVFVGYKKASFSYGWAANYYDNFVGPKRDVVRDFEGRDLLNAHGVTGTILEVGSSQIVIKGSHGIEKVILVGKDTIINNRGDKVNVSDLKVNDQIVVIGAPNDAGQILASLIRVLPPMPPSASGMPPIPLQPK